MGLCWVFFFFLLQMGFHGWVMKLVGWSIKLVVVGALDCCGSLTWGGGGGFLVCYGVNYGGLDVGGF